MSAALAALLGRQAAEALDVEVGAYVTSALRDHAAGDLDGDELAECLRGVCAELLEALPDEALAQATQRALVAMQCDMGANEDIEEAGGGQCGCQSGEAGAGAGHLFFFAEKATVSDFLVSKAERFGDRLGFLIYESDIDRYISLSNQNATLTEFWLPELRVLRGM